MGQRRKRLSGRAGRGSVLGVELVTVGPYEVELTRKRIKRAYLRLDDPDGPVRVSTPMSMPLAEVRGFVESHQPWIESRRRILADAIPASPRRGHISADGTVLLWGAPRALEEVAPKAAALMAERPCPQQMRERAEKALARELRAQLDAVARPLLNRYAAQMAVAPSELRYRDMQTRWGTCNVKARRIWLALSLAHFPPECTELIVVHELCHLIEPGHGPRFYACMDRYLPDWRGREALLKRTSRGR